MAGEKAEDVCRNIRCPQLVLAAGSDPNNVKQGGLLFNTLRSVRGFVFL